MVGMQGVKRTSLALEEHTLAVRKREGCGGAQLLGRGGEGGLNRDEAVELEAEGAFGHRSRRKWGLRPERARIKKSSGMGGRGMRQG